jgi:N-acetylglucosamine-6-phosphate deacetylase
VNGVGGRGDVTVAGARVVTPDGVIECGVVTVEAERIVGIDRRRPHTPGAPTTIDGSGLTLLPGFLDVHVHGGGGADVMEANPEAIRAMLRAHGRHGTTGLLLTTITESRDAVTAALRCARDACFQGAAFCGDGAAPLGVHLEGPYLCAARAGAQPREYVRDFDAAEWAEWIETAAGTIRLLTCAPERPGAEALLRAAGAANVVVSVGHTDADAAQTERALDAGAHHATHLFNAMRPLHHRNPGPIPPLLTDPRVLVEIIADGHHLAPEIVRLVLAAKGDRHVALITDAMAAAADEDPGDGVYALGGHSVTVRDGRATLADGTLAGSVLTMDRAAANVRAWTSAPWETIARLTSGNVAAEMGWSNKGRIEPGADADFVLVDDSLTVHSTFVAGRCIFAR